MHEADNLVKPGSRSGGLLPLLTISKLLVINRHVQNHAAMILLL